MEENFNQSKKESKIHSPVFAFVLIFIISSIVPIVFLLCGFSKTVICIVFFICSIVLCSMYFFRIYAPVKKLAKYISSIGKGDFGERIENRDALPELKSLSSELDFFVNSTLNNLISDLKMEILHTQDTSNEFLTKVQDAVTNSSRISLGADYIRERVENLQALADGNANENNLIKKSISEYRNIVQSQNRKIEETGITLNKIIADLKSSSGKLLEKKELSSQLSSVTKNVSAKVKETANAVEKISENLDLLNNTIKIIASVANRTNLLAMNASIEAAHAGSSGAGFAVVAEEIRTLSEQTNKQVKSITSSIKTMALAIQDAVVSSKETGNSFEEISKQVENYVETFDSVIDDYSAAGKNNEIVAKGYENIKNVESGLRSEVEKIDSSIGKNIQKIQGINSCITEIGNIVDRNTKEALALSRSQDPIYINAVTNGKKLELIRRKIDVFRLSSVPMEIWTADKKKLWSVIQALFDHLDCTVMLLEFLHGKSNAVISQTQKGTSKFEKWLYSEGKENYGNQPCFSNIVKIDEEIHEKASVLIKLSEVGKEQEATIEFSEILELSRRLVVELGELKTFIVKNLTKQNINNSTKENVALSSEENDLSNANESFIQAQNSIVQKNEEEQNLDIENVEELEEVEPLEEENTAAKKQEPINDGSVSVNLEDI